MLFALAVNNDKDNLYKGYFPFEEHKGYIFTLDKSKEVLTQVFGERDYSLKNLNDEEEKNAHYLNLDFGWNNPYIADNLTAYIMDGKLYTNFDLINLWYDVEGDPVPTAIANCDITYNIKQSNDKYYLQFEDMKVVSKLID